MPEAQTCAVIAKAAEKVPDAAGAVRCLIAIKLPRSRTLRMPDPPGWLFSRQIEAAEDVLYRGLSMLQTRLSFNGRLDRDRVDHMDWCSGEPCFDIVDTTLSQEVEPFLSLISSMRCENDLITFQNRMISG